MYELRKNSAFDLLNDRCECFVREVSDGQVYIRGKTEMLEGGKVTHRCGRGPKSRVLSTSLSCRGGRGCYVPISSACSCWREACVGLAGSEYYERAEAKPDTLGVAGGETDQHQSPGSEGGYLRSS